MTASRIHILLAALMGASGVALWAMAAHRPGTGNLVTAAQFLLFHSPAIIAITTCRKQGLLSNRTASLAVALLVIGTLLFAGDLVARTHLGRGLFTMAAPIGGSTTLLGWLTVALAAILPIKASDASHQ